MPTRALVDVVGTVDLHLHSAPSYSHSRPYDDEETARQAKEAGMAGILLKDHTESTVTRAYLAQKMVPGVRVFGGIVLNHPVGGVNPEAADFALTMGGKQVWMPTADAARHAETFGQGGYILRLSQPGLGPAEPEKKSRHLLKKATIRILKDGQLIEEAKDVVRICKVWDAMLGVSHLHDDEVVALVQFAKEEGFKKVVITHANWTIIRGHKSGELKELRDMGAWIEFCGTAMLPPYSCLTLDEEIRWLNELGTQRCVLASDAGAQIYGTEPSMFRAYLQILNNAGLPIEAIKKMAIDNPKSLLHMD